MKKIYILIIGITALAFLSSATQFRYTENISVQKQEKIKLGTYEDLSAVEFKKLVDENKYTLVDVRTQQEYKQGHIEGSINIDWYQRTFETQIQKLDKTKPVLIYCHSGNRTSKTKFAMLGMGFQKIYNLNYGANDWAKNKFSFVK